jgi:hypothetical protein
MVALIVIMKVVVMMGNPNHQDGCTRLMIGGWNASISMIPTGSGRVGGRLQPTTHARGQSQRNER